MRPAHDVSELTSLRYEMRRFLAVVPDDIAPLGGWRDPPTLMRNQELPGTLVAKLLGELAGDYRLPALRVGAPNSDVVLAYVGRSDAAQLTFPTGNPPDDVLHVAHPHDANVYYAADQYEQRIVADRAGEAIELMRSLGADFVEVLHQQDETASGGLTASLLVPALGGTVGAEAEATSSVGNSVRYALRFNVREHEPALPDTLRWYASEPAWQKVAEQRLAHDVREFDLEISGNQDSAITASVSVALPYVGVTFGGSMQTSSSTRWRLRGTFAAIGR